MVDLQWQRQSELWLRLMNVKGVSAAAHIAIRFGQDTCYLEQDEGRARLAVCRPVRSEQRKPILLRLLNILQPEASNGIPMRAWGSREGIWLAATAPQDTGAELWADLSRRQIRLLDRVTAGSHEKYY